MIAKQSLAGQYPGMKMIYLEAESGTEWSVSVAVIEKTKHTIYIRVVIGGGIRTTDDVHEKVIARASVVVGGNVLGKKRNGSLVSETINAIQGIMTVE